MADASSMTPALPDDHNYGQKLDEKLASNEAEVVAGNQSTSQTIENSSVSAASPSAIAGHNSSAASSTNEKEPRESIIGATGLLMFIILLAVVAILLLRWWGVLPLSNSSTAQKLEQAGKTAEADRAYALIATYNGRLYYFDQQQERIMMVALPFTLDSATTPSGTTPINAPAAPIPRGPAKLIRAVNKVLPSPDGKKVALFANRNTSRSHIFVLDFARLDSAKLEDQAEFMTCWTEKLPGDYSLRTYDIAAWSPDNQALAFVAGTEDQPDLFISTSKDKVQRVTYHGKNIGTVLWLDAQRLAFVANLDGRDQMYVIYPNWGVKELAR